MSRYVCPGCGHGDKFETLETFTGTAGVESITTDGGIKWNGDTHIDRESAQSTGIRCTHCQWQDLSPDWQRDLMVEANEWYPGK